MRALMSIRGFGAGCATLALAASTAPAAASESSGFEVYVEPWNETIACGQVVGVARGTAIYRVHVTDTEDGVDFRLSERVVGATMTGSDGESYRVVGAGSASGSVVSGEHVLDRHVINFVVVGDGGRLGGLHVRFDGSTWTVRGGCEFA